MRRVCSMLLVFQLAVSGYAKLPFNGVRFFNAVPPPASFVFELNDMPIAKATPYLRASKFVDIVNGMVPMNGVLREDDVVVATLARDNWNGHQTWIALWNGTVPTLLRAPTFPNSDKSVSLLHLVHASPDAGTITAIWADSLENTVTYGNTVGNIQLTPGRHTVKLVRGGSTFFEKSFKMPRKGTTMVIISGSPSDLLNPLTVTVINHKGKPVRLKSIP